MNDFALFARLNVTDSILHNRVDPFNVFEVVVDADLLVDGCESLARAGGDARQIQYLSLVAQAESAMPLTVHV